MIPFTHVIHKISDLTHTSCGLRWSPDNRRRTGFGLSIPPRGGQVYVYEGSYHGPQRASIDIADVSCELCCIIEDVPVPDTLPNTPFNNNPPQVTYTVDVVNDGKVRGITDCLEKIDERIEHHKRIKERDEEMIKKKALTKAASLAEAEPIPCGYHMYEEDVLPPELKSYTVVYNSQDLESHVVKCMHCGLTTPLQSSRELALTVWEQLSLAINLGIDEETIDPIEILDSRHDFPVTEKSSSSKSDSAPRTRKRKSNISDEELESAIEILKSHQPDGDGKSDILEATGVDARLWQKAVVLLLEEGIWRSTGQKRGTRYYAN